MRVRVVFLLVEYYCIFRKFRKMQRRLLAKGFEGIGACGRCVVWYRILSLLKSEEIVMFVCRNDVI